MQCVQRFDQEIRLLHIGHVQSVRGTKWRKEKRRYQSMSELATNWQRPMLPSSPVHQHTACVRSASIPAPIQSIVEDHHRSREYIGFQRRPVSDCCTYNSSPQPEDLLPRRARRQEKTKRIKIKTETEIRWKRSRAS